MTIQPLWILCLIIRFFLLIITGKIAISNNLKLRVLTCLILVAMGVGFIYKYYTGSNNEFQISKVFWHETRLVHGVLYILASYYLFNKNSLMSMLILGIDIIFSIIYRISSNQ